MKCLKVSLIILCAMALVLGCARVSVVQGSDGISSTLAETATVYVNCTTSQVTVNSMISSQNTSLIHFPNAITMTDPNLTNVTTLLVTFSTGQSSLIFTFNNTDTSSARTQADAVASGVGSAFQTTFSWVSTGVSSGQSNVTYSGSGKSNLTQYTESLMNSDLMSSLGGISSTFLPMTLNSNALMAMTASKDSGAFDWTYTMIVSYPTNIPNGSGNHQINVLALLDVTSIAPSPYAYSSSGSIYSSEIFAYITSNDTVSYVLSQPALGTPPARCWYLMPGGQATVITAVFYFGSDPSAVSPLTFTFSSIVLPEFQLVALLFVMVVVGTAALISRKRIRRLKTTIAID